MRIDYFNKRPEVGGVYLYVNERSVGKPKDFALHKILRSLEDRVYAEVHANGLRPYVSFDRSSFVECEETDQVKKWVVKNLRDAGNSIRREQKETKRKIPEIQD